ncbi:MAG: DsbA family protein [Anaerolineae bacterium]|nr:DsbA family protein [Anaerolineae bacterium]
MTRRKMKARKRIPREPTRAHKEQTLRRYLLPGGIALVLIASVVVVAVLVANRGKEEKAAMMYRSIAGGFTEEGFPFLGSPDAPVTLVEFTDFNCSHCRAYNLEHEASILEEFVATGKVRYIVHYYSSGSPHSMQATEAAMCAADQQKYFQFQHALFEESATSREEFLALARKVGLNEREFAACWDSERHREALLKHMQAAAEAGIYSTPTFKINDRLVVGNRPEVIRQVIQEELALAGY